MTALRVDIEEQSISARSKIVSCQYSPFNRRGSTQKVSKITGM